MSEAEEPKAAPELVDIKADIVFPHKLGPDSSVLCLVGNFAAQHNGAVITADSAVRYGNDRLDCFGNVLINKNTTYAYADRAVYDGLSNEITLYSPIVKVVDEDVTLYTYNFRFNTLDNIGTYWGGGVASNADSSRLESVRGYYYADLKEVVGVEEVEIYTTSYEMKGDSVIYNMESDHARFFDNTDIWNKKGEYLSTDRGDYNKEEDRFSFTRKGYMLSSEREAWSDSMDHYQALDETILRGNIQMDDTTNKMLVYSHFAHHWDREEKLFLSQRPLVVNYDPEQADTMFMRGDTIIITTHHVDIEQQPETSTPEAQAESAPETGAPPHDHNHDHSQRDKDAKKSQSADSGATVEADSLSQAADTLSKKERKAIAKAEKLQQKEDEKRAIEEAKVRREQLIEERLQKAIIERVQAKAKADSLAAIAKDTTLVAEVADSLAVESEPIAEVKSPIVEADSLARDSVSMTLTDAEIEDLRSEVVHKINIEEKKQQAEAKRLRVEAISRERIRQRAEKMDAQKARAARAAAARKAKIDAKRIKRGKTTAEEIAAADSLDSLRVVDSLRIRDSVRMADSLKKIPPVDSVTVEVERKVDSIYRIIVAYRNTKTYQGEQQSVSDSLMVDSRDSTLHLYLDPYIWNGMNQVSSDVMDIYTRNKELDKAVFTGTPIMASKIDTTYYNQVTGKTITSYFRDNDIYRNDVESNVQTIYFARDEDTGEVTTMVYLESGSASFYIKNQELEGITYRISPSYIFYPVALIPTTQPMRLEGFKWKEELRPVRSDFSDWERRPSVRQEKEALLRPEFPIEKNLRIDIENYVRDRYWMDRTDVVASHAEEWLESLGHKSGQPRTEPIK